MRNNKLKTVSLLIAISLYACSPKITQNGKASFYADKFSGRKTANGETFRNNKLTGAHKTLRFGTKVKVTNKNNGKSVKARINDRGPFVTGRIIDLSKKAAKKIDLDKAGGCRGRNQIQQKLILTQRNKNIFQCAFVRF